MLRVSSLLSDALGAFIILPESSHRLQAVPPPLRTLHEDKILWLVWTQKALWDIHNKLQTSSATFSFRPWPGHQQADNLKLHVR